MAHWPMPQLVVVGSYRGTDLSRKAPGGELVPYDLDVHDIPARKQDPLHEHHDVRFLLIAGADQELVVSDESHDLAWVPLEDLERYTDEVSVLRLRDKLPW